MMDIWDLGARWGTQQMLGVHPVQPVVVMEVAVDVARDSAGWWRHPARPHRMRDGHHPLPLPSNHRRRTEGRTSASPLPAWRPHALTHTTRVETHISGRCSHHRRGELLR